MKVTTKQRLALTTLAVLAATTTSVWAVDASTVEYPNFDTLVVTGTRTEEPVSKVPANMSVVTGKELQDRHVTNMEEALRTVPGLYQQSYASSGYESSHMIRINGSDNVQYLVDGLSMTMPNMGYFTPVQTFQNIGGIDRVEVLKGAASSLYGSNAVGGVINVITAKPQEGVKTKVRLMGGSYNQEQYGIANEGRQGNIYWRASYVKDHMGDFKDARGQEFTNFNQSHTASFMVGSEIDKKNDVRVAYDSYRANVTYADSKQYWLNNPNWQMLTGPWGPYAGNTGGRGMLARTGHRSYDSLRLIWDNTINDNWKHSFHVARNEYKTNDFDPLINGIRHSLVNPPTSLGVRTINVGDQVTYAKGKHTAVGGFEWEQDKAMTVNNKKVTNMAYYIQDVYKVAPKWTLTPGLRLDHHSAFGTHTSPHMSVGYDVNDKTNVYLAYNRFFVAPSAYQLYDPSYGNAHLKPEQGYEWSAGVHHKWNRDLYANASMFARKTTDKFGPDSAYKYINVNNEKAYGFSADLQKKMGADWATRIGYTYTNVKAGAKSAANINGYVPKHEIVTGVDYAHNKWDAHFDMRIAANRRGPVSAHGPAFPRNSYAVANLSANYQANENVKIFGAVNNLFDTYYAEATNVSYGGAGDWWSMPGRNYRLGVELSF